ncbi:MAG: hypothetical protein ACPL1D_01745 [Microgenomates group bacterium]
MKRQNIFLGILLLFFCFSFFLFDFVFAVSMESPLFKIESASVSNAAGEKSSTNYRLSDTLGQLAAGEFSSTGYIIKAGFQYIHSIIPFSFSISKTRIDLGTLLPNTPSTDQTVLTVSFGSSGQYQVTAQEIGPLSTLNGANFIPDTQCDGGSNTCNETLAKPWTNNSAYGFGYNMSGNDIPSDFIDSTYFRPFPDRLQNEPPAIVMSSTNVGRNRQATMTFKVNVSSVQPAGNYQTVINFVATPSF